MSTIFTEKIKDQHSTRLPLSYPDVVAKRFLKQYAAVLYYLGDYYRYETNRYRRIESGLLESNLREWLGTQKNYHGEKVAIKNSLVSNIMNELQAQCFVSGHVSTPVYIGAGKWPTRFFALQDAVYDLDHFIRTGQHLLLPHTPSLFATSCATFAFDPSATCPRWLAFLDDVFNQDAQSSEALRRWFAYNLIDDYFFEKGLLCQGNSRAGKGIVLKLLQALLGDDFCSNPNTANLGDKNGKWDLIGKRAALIHESHIGSHADMNQIVEFIKILTSHAPTQVEAKYKQAVRVTLSAKLTMAMNVLPTLSDSSDALTNRFIYLHFPNSYLGREDPNLFRTLTTELPGIFCWALGALRDLMAEQVIRQPDNGAWIKEDFQAASNPVRAFIDQCCDTGPDKQVLTGNLYSLYARWCERNGHKPQCQPRFGTSLRTQVATLRKVKPREGEKRFHVYTGIAATKEAVREYLGVLQAPLPPSD